MHDYAYTTGAPGNPIRSYNYGYGDANWKDKLTSYDGNAITYDAIGNPLYDGERHYTWGAGRQLRHISMPVPGVEHGIRVSDGAHEDSGTLLRIARNGYTLEAKLFRDGREITAERPANAFNWTRSSGDATADAAWNAAHAGMKQIAFSEAEISGGAQYNCVYTEKQGQYGTMIVGNDNTLVHTPGTADADHKFSLTEGMLEVDIPNNAGDDTEYQLTNGVLTVNPGFTGTITAEYEFTSSPTREIDFAAALANALAAAPSPTREIGFEYDHNGLRTQKRIVENGVTTTCDYTLHGKRIAHMTKRTMQVDGAETRWFICQNTNIILWCHE